MKATNIEWDFDNIDTNETPMDGFPKEIEIPSNIDENDVAEDNVVYLMFD